MLRAVKACLPVCLLGNVSLAQGLTLNHQGGQGTNGSHSPRPGGGGGEGGSGAYAGVSHVQNFNLRSVSSATISFFFSPADKMNYHL